MIDKSFSLLLGFSTATFFEVSVLKEVRIFRFSPQFQYNPYISALKSQP